MQKEFGIKPHGHIQLVKTLGQTQHMLKGLHIQYELETPQNPQSRAGGCD